MVRCAVIALLMLSAPIGTLRADDEPQFIRTVEGISELKLANGLQVLLFPDVSKPTVTVNLTIFVGSRHEGYGEAGMAHLLEHMLFKGTPSHPAIPAELTKRGAQFNGTTWLDRTVKMQIVPASLTPTTDMLLAEASGDDGTLTLEASGRSSSQL